MQHFPGGKNVPYYLENMLLSHCHPSENNLADFFKADAGKYYSYWAYVNLRFS
jgi:hypothetical protein